MNATINFLTRVLFVFLPVAELLSREDYEPGVILLQVRQPNVVAFNAKL